MIATLYFTINYLLSIYAQKDRPQNQPLKQALVKLTAHVAKVGLFPSTYQGATRETATTGRVLHSKCRYQA
jgi:hypothetical protein